MAIFYSKLLVYQRVSQLHIRGMWQMSHQSHVEVLPLFMCVIL